MTVTIDKEFVILCEGKADSNFVQKLLEIRADIPPIDFLPTDEFYGSKNFNKMLSALKGTGHAFKGIKGVLIIADSHDKPEDTFEIVRQQISGEGYPTPSKLSEIARTDGYPAMAVTLLPDDITPGALETLFLRAIFVDTPWLQDCVNSYLSCEKIEALKWAPEKLDKARYHSVVAATHHDDPSRAASFAFRKPPVLAIAHDVLKDVADRIKAFCDGVVAR
jgi:hypothetical protein